VIPNYALWVGDFAACLGGGLGVEERERSQRAGAAGEGRGKSEYAIGGISRTNTLMRKNQVPANS